MSLFEPKRTINSGVSTGEPLVSKKSLIHPPLNHILHQPVSDATVATSIFDPADAFMDKKKKRTVKDINESWLTNSEW